MSKHVLWLRRLLWLYCVLWFVEGALRKWVVPSLSNPLLIVRDPIVIAMYAVAFAGRLFPVNRFVIVSGILGFLSLVAGFIALQEAPLVVLYGFRTDFLHLPLIFLIPRIITRDDVMLLGRWTLILAVPTALLMVAQFQAAPNAWLNAGAGEGSAQIEGGDGHIRPAGTFSYILGPTCLYALTATYLLVSQVLKTKWPAVLTAAAALSLLVATVVSSSRSMVGGIGLVVLAAVMTGTLLCPHLFVRQVKALALLLVVGIVVMQLPIFGEGTAAFSNRFSSVDSSNEELMPRIIGNFTKPLAVFNDVPWLGVGLGMGTNAGAALMTGKAQFLVEEMELPRNVLESGPILGMGFVLFRAWLCIVIGAASVRQARRGDPLAFLMFAACAPNLLSGNFGVPTTLGFSVLTGGLCLAALQTTSVQRLPQTESAFPDAMQKKLRVG